jgi:hypothetical protein
MLGYQMTMRAISPLGCRLVVTKTSLHLTLSILLGSVSIEFLLLFHDCLF